MMSAKISLIDILFLEDMLSWQTNQLKTSFATYCNLAKHQIYTYM